MLPCGALTNVLGIEVMLITGRRHTFAVPMAEQLGFDLWLISSNGAATRSLHGESFHRDLLPVQKCRGLCSAMCDFLANTVITFDKESQGGRSTDELTTSIQRWLEKNMQYIEFVVPIRTRCRYHPCAGNVLCTIARTA